MKPQEAYTLLEVSPDISEEELRKKYKHLAKTYHPDINKEPGSEQKFKEISEAYQTIEKFRNAPQQQGFDVNLQDIFNNFAGFNPQRRQRRMVPNIELKEKLSFKESILGARRSLKYSREEKCQSCNGVGRKQKKTDCQKCGGSGMRQVTQGNSRMVMPCECRTTAVAEACQECKEKGSQQKEITIDVEIPPGVQNGNTIQLSSVGNFVESSIFGDSYSSLFLHIETESHSSLKVENQDVVYPLTISLKEAIEGKAVEVPTIDGDKTIEVPPLSRHKEEVVLPNLGLGRQGNQRIVLDVSYPKDTKSLIDTLGVN